MGSIRQEIALKNILRLNNQTRMWLEIISMPALDLKERIEKEMQDNPVLEVASKDGFSGNNKSKDIDSIIENTLSDKNITLFSYLQQQINIAFDNEKDITLAEHIVSFINKDGYITTDTIEISNTLGVSVKKINEILSIIKTFDPVGIASFSIEECLITQLNNLENNEITNLAKLIVKHHLNDIAKKKYDEIIKATDSSKENFNKALSLIKTLEPYPARGYDTTEIKYVIPELFIFKENDKWIVKVDNNYIPRLQISKKYIKLVSEAKDKETLNYLKGKIADANSIINAVSERKKSLLNIGNALLKLQYSFFEFGKEYLRPLRLKDIASFEGVNLSLSSVSRLSNSKYVETPYGVFALKFFFSYAVSDYLGSRSVKEIIRHIILESGEKKLSDEKIRVILKEKGIELSRRTVNKYRNSMNLFSSR